MSINTTSSVTVETSDTRVDIPEQEGITVSGTQAQEVEIQKVESPIEGIKKEYSIVGDGLYASVNVDEAPVWLTTILDATVATAVTAGVASYDAAAQDVRNSIDLINTINNNYVSTIDFGTLFDTRYSTKLDQLNASLGTTYATHTDVNTAIANADVASTQDITDLTAALNNEVTARNTAISDAVAGEAGVRATELTTLSTSFTNQQGVLATAISDLETSTTTSINNTATTIQNTFAYNSSIQIDGSYYKSGFGLDTTGTSGGDGLTPETAFDSEFWINAAKFKFTNDDQTGSIAPFTIDASGPTPQISFNGQVSFTNVTDVVVPTVYQDSIVPDNDNLSNKDVWIYNIENIGTWKYVEGNPVTVDWSSLSTDVLDLNGNIPSAFSAITTWFTEVLPSGFARADTDESGSIEAYDALDLLKYGQGTLTDTAILNRIVANIETPILNGSAPEAVISRYTSKGWQPASDAIPSQYLHPDDTTKINGGSIYAGSIHGNAITAGTLDASVIDANSINTWTLDASQITTGTLDAIGITGSTISGGSITGTTISGSIISSTAYAAVTEAGAPHTGYTVGVQDSSSTSNGSGALIGAALNIKPYNYHLTATSSVVDFTSNQWRYRRHVVSPYIHGYIDVTSASNAYYDNYRNVVAARVRLKLHSASSGGSVIAQHVFDLNILTDNSTTTKVLTASNGGFTFTLSYGRNNWDSSDGWSTWFYSQINTNNIQYNISGSAGFSDNDSLGLYATAEYYDVGHGLGLGYKELHIEDVADNDY